MRSGLASGAAQTERHLRELITRFIADRVGLDEFERQFVERSRMKGTASKTVLDLVYSVELALAEFSHGHWTEGELKELLARSLGAPATREPPARHASGAS